MTQRLRHEFRKCRCEKNLGFLYDVNICVICHRSCFNWFTDDHVRVEIIYGRKNGKTRVIFSRYYTRKILDQCGRNISRNMQVQDGKFRRYPYHDYREHTSRANGTTSIGPTPGHGVNGEQNFTPLLSHLQFEAHHRDEQLANGVSCATLPTLCPFFTSKTGWVRLYTLCGVRPSPLAISNMEHLVQAPITLNMLWSCTRCLNLSASYPLVPRCGYY